MVPQLAGRAFSLISLPGGPAQELGRVPAGPDRAGNNAPTNAALRSTELGRARFYFGARSGADDAAFHHRAFLAPVLGPAAQV
jgi:hypothetical protein